ncbi:putative LRR receptor-like protein kinase [Cucumis melo var. makuwa]|nr:putative LRR receptor-like protein kinase [Cucumis melo var. makuwa]TYK05093.1 putative LRR receptor-like protein kinase [Cucumis melo var. makuwa]
MATCSSVIFSASVIEDLNTLHPPLDFNSTISKNCHLNPSLRYCSASPMDLIEIFKSSIVASHLCNESRNPNCVESFPKIDLRSRPKIAPLYLSFHFFWKYCPLSIHSIDLSNNSLKGSFPVDVLECKQIEVLDLSRNELDGEVPFRIFSDLTNLTVLNLSNNKFTESKMSDLELFFKRFNSSSFISSGLLPDHRKYQMKAVILLFVFPILVIVVVWFLWWLCFHRPDFLPRMLRRKNKFTPAMLRAATGGFLKKNLIVKCKGVDIYSGVLRDGTEVRIEIYGNEISRESRKEFIEECKILAQLSHKNLVKLLGWCGNRGMRAIVIEWLEGESIDMWLSRSPPPWKRRLKVAKGVLEGMLYLQEEWPGVDYDLRTNSLLLTRKLVPLISRFKLGHRNGSSNNIYKFGVLLLEMIVNPQLRDEIKQGESDFVGYIKMQLPNNLQAVINEDIELQRESMVNQGKAAINLALMCTDQSSGHQPNLKYIFDNVTRFLSNHKMHETEEGRHTRILSR